jgi:cell division protein FtsB
MPASRGGAAPPPRRGGQGRGTGASSGRRAARFEPGRASRAEPGRSARPIRVDAGRTASSAARPAQRGRPTAASRPAGVRRPNTGTAATRTRAPQPRRFTGRAAVLGMVLVGLLLAYAYPVRVYLAQQAEIAGLEQQQREQRERIAGLADERAKWDDPEFVKAKAKKELQYVLPGEISIVPLPDAVAAGASPTTQPDPAAADPWYKKLWSSVEVANG